MSELQKIQKYLGANNNKHALNCLIKTTEVV